MGHNLTWTMGRQLASFDGITYTYNESGIRTSKTVDGVTTKYYLDGTNIIEQTDGTTTLHFYYDSSNELIGFNYVDNDYFYMKNQQGDITDITNSNGEVVASYEYDPWGKVVSVSGNSEIGELNPFRYSSYYYDAEIQMYYLQSRYYDADVGRFINCDGVNYIGTSESEVSYNPFAYCENNPVNQEDPTGSFGTPIQWAFSILGAIAGLPLGKWIANRLGYYSGWKYYAIRSAVVGGDALGWFAGGRLVKLISQYLKTHPAVYSRIVNRFGMKTMNVIRRLIGWPAITVSTSRIPYSWQEAEEIIRSTYNAVKHTFRNIPKLGNRVVDGYSKSKGTIYEVKYGYMSLTDFIKKEIAKDKYLLNNKIVKKVEWHFYISQTTGKGGPSKPLEAALRKAGFSVFYH